MQHNDATQYQHNHPKKRPLCLLIEDNAIIQRAICLVLDDLGCQIDVADTGGKAIQSFQDTLYDFVILDLGLPDIHGFIVARSLRAIEQKRHDRATPILVLSAHDKRRQMVDIEDGLITDYFVKPLTYEQAELMLAYVDKAG